MFLFTAFRNLARHFAEEVRAGLKESVSVPENETPAPSIIDEIYQASARPLSRHEQQQQNLRGRHQAGSHNKRNAAAPSHRRRY